MGDYTRSVELRTTANAGKLVAVREYVAMCVVAKNIIKHDKIQDLKRGGRIRRWSKHEWSLPTPDCLSARQLKSVENVVNSALKSWQARAVSVGRSVIGRWLHDGDITDDQAHALYSVNVRHRWWVDIDVEYCHVLISAILRRNPWPVFTSQSTTVDDLVATYGSRAQGWWLSLKVLNGRTVDLPLVDNPYFRQCVASGTEAKVTTISCGKHGVRFHRPVRYESSPPRTTGDTVGCDWGLNTLISTSDGRLLGRNLYQWLLRVDDQVTTLAASLQKQDIKPTDSKRYRKLVRRIRQHVRNEVGRIFNRLSREDVATLVVEKLNFTGGGLSRRLNRIVSKAGRRELSRKLQDMEDKHGIQVVSVRPEYTSQTCRSCGAVDARSRDRETFSCTFCGRTVHADINAARNIAHRYRDVPVPRYGSRTHCLAVLDSRFSQYWGMDANRVRQRCRSVRPTHAPAVGLRGTTCAVNGVRGCVKE